MSTVPSILAPAPRYARLTGTPLLYWSDNTTPFNGFALVGLIWPSTISGSNTYSSLDYGNLYPSISLPRWQRLPIVFGQVNTSLGLFVNNDLVPPGSQYICSYYDSTGTLIAGPSSPFTVTAGPESFPGGNVIGPISLPVLTLPLPGQLGPNPIPDSGPGADGDA